MVLNNISINKTTTYLNCNIFFWFSECVNFSKDLLIVIFSSEYKDFIKGDYSRREAGRACWKEMEVKIRKLFNKISFYFMSYLCCFVYLDCVVLSTWIVLFCLPGLCCFVQVDKTTQSK
jgi:hypothetical protein